MVLSDARLLLADALNDAGLGFNVRTKPIKSPRPRDGWVQVEAIRPGFSNTSCEVDFSIVLLVGNGADFTTAEDALEAAPSLVQTLSILPVTDLQVEPATVPVANSGFLALVITLKMEI